MTRPLTILLLAPALLVGCARRDPVTQGTLAELHDVPPDVEETRIDNGLEQAMESYRRFLEETDETAMTPEAMRRLADLQLEQEFGIQGGDSPRPERPVQTAAVAPDQQVPGRSTATASPLDLVAPEPAQPSEGSLTGTIGPGTGLVGPGLGESEQEFEDRTTAELGILRPSGEFALPQGIDADPSGALEAIAIYDRLLTEYPSYENSDQVLYQKARAYDELGRTEEAIDTMGRLIDTNPYSDHYDEVQFRRGEYFFTRRRYFDAEDAYSSIVRRGDRSSYHELALYKLGWTFYKQELYEEALHQYMALLDYKVSIGYDFDQSHAEDEERRVADTFRAISLSFSYLGGPETVTDYFATFGNRSYEDRVYSNLGEHYLAKLRYDDAARTYRAFEALYPFDRAAPHFNMRVIEIFTEGGFPALVLESKRDFASKYGLRAEYWSYYTPEESPDVLAYLKANLRDLATHYHAEYQEADETEQAAERQASYEEARRWYGDYLDSFPTDDDTPPINYRLADLLLEHEDFGAAAGEYERTAYDYPQHAQSAEAGYAAVYAHREELRVAEEDRQDAVKRETVASSLRFADTFPEHAQAPTVLGAAADDMYELEEYAAARESAHRLIDTYPGAETSIRRSAWIVVAHASFDLAEFPEAEQAYTEVLALTPEDDESHAGFVDNLAASIYQQGDIANAAGDYRAAADHFLRIRTAAPTSSIRPSAEYDAGAALMALEDWPSAASVFEAFRSSYPDHELANDATRQIAFAYREDGQLLRAADEYDRFATESEDPALRSEAMLVAGDLYVEGNSPSRALGPYRRYVEEFPSPVEPNLETRVKIADIHKAAEHEGLYLEELEAIVRAEAEAGPERTTRTRTIGGRSALVLAERDYEEFVEVRLSQPFETSLQEKQRRMDQTIDAMEHLIGYEIADVTAAATYYMAETYFDFSRSLMESERPADLLPEEMTTYELNLDEIAFPFEERAIDVHEENIELLHGGVFNEWTEKSLGRLAELMPGRYAKSEADSVFLGLDDVEVYGPQIWQLSAPTPVAATGASADPEATLPVSEADLPGGAQDASQR